MEIKYLVSKCADVTSNDNESGYIDTNILYITGEYMFFNFDRSHKKSVKSKN